MATASVAMGSWKTTLLKAAASPGVDALAPRAANATRGEGGEGGEGGGGGEGGEGGVGGVGWQGGIG